MADPIDEAIASAETKRTVAMRQVSFNLMPSGKPIKIEIPANITEPEGFALVEAVVQIVRQAIAQQPRVAKPRLVLPG